MRETKREQDIDLLFHLIIHSLVDSCMCPDLGSNPQPWHVGVALKPINLPSQGSHSAFKSQPHWGFLRETHLNPVSELDPCVILTEVPYYFPLSPISSFQIIYSTVFIYLRPDSPTRMYAPEGKGPILFSTVSLAPGIGLGTCRYSITFC